MHQARQKKKKNRLHVRPILIEQMSLLFTVYLFEIYGGDIGTVQCFDTWVRWEKILLRLQLGNEGMSRSEPWLSGRIVPESQLDVCALKFGCGSEG